MRFWEICHIRTGKRTPEQIKADKQKQVISDRRFVSSMRNLDSRAERMQTKREADIHHGGGPVNKKEDCRLLYLEDLIPGKINKNMI